MITEECVSLKQQALKIQSFIFKRDYDVFINDWFTFHCNQYTFTIYFDNLKLMPVIQISDGIKLINESIFNDFTLPIDVKDFLIFNVDLIFIPRY